LYEIALALEPPTVVVVVHGEVQLSLSTPTAERRRTTIPVIGSPDAI